MVPIIRSSTFSLFPEIISGMSTRIGGVSPAPLGMNTGRHDIDTQENIFANRKIFCDALGFDVSRLATQSQVHGESISIVDTPCTVDANDALITTTKNIFLGVSVADCQPVLLFDRAQQIVAAVHAGWRGAAAKIVTKAAQKLFNDFQSRPENMFAFVGPCAASCCYEVDDFTASHFAPEVSRAKENGKFLLDLKAASHTELRALGIPATNIEISPCCTICMPEYFHSHRREGIHAGRMMAVIGMRGE